jgi:hypothetical protein
MKMSINSPHTLPKDDVLNFIATKVDDLNNNKSTNESDSDSDPNILVKHHEHFFELRVRRA